MPPPVTRIDIDAVVEAARAEMNARDHAAALARLNAAVEVVPEHAEASMLLARCAARVGDDELRARIGEAILSRFPGDARALAAAGEALMKAGLTDRAQAAFEAALAAKPGQVSVLRSLARLHESTGAYAKAIPLIEEMTRVVPSEGEHVLHLMEVLRLAGDLDGLARQAARVVAIHPAIAVEVAVSLIAMDQPECAAVIVAAMAPADRVGPLGAPLLRHVRKQGRAARERADVPGELRAWRALLLLQPDDHEAASQLRRLFATLRDEGRAAVAAGALDQAQQAFASAAELSADNAALLREAAVLAERREDWPLAVMLWGRLRDLGGDEVLAVLDRLSRAALRAEDFDCAITARLQAKTRAPEDAEAARMLEWTLRQAVARARQMADAGEPLRAARIAATVLRHEPGQRGAAKIIHRITTDLVTALRGAADPAAAAATADLLVQIAPNQPDALLFMARAAEAAKHRIDAAQLYEKLATGPKARASYWAKAVKLYRSGGDPQRALDVLHRSLLAFPGDPALLEASRSQDETAHAV